MTKTEMAEKLRARMKAHPRLYKRALRSLSVSRPEAVSALKGAGVLPDPGVDQDPSQEPEKSE